MYIIGNNIFNFIKITNNSMICGCEIYTEVAKVEYSVPLHDSTIIYNRDDARKILKEIIERVKEIEFKNYSIIGELIDKNGSFDKTEFSKELKIYELVPREAIEEELEF
ncbi:MAG: hypothetical protein IKY26_09285 [Erysipelotrichaceae bacterium]|nr:hypothetical protein [Erysipelotrichaceae bacterium]